MTDTIVSAAAAPGTTQDFRSHYGLRRLLLYAVAAVALGVIIAGFWNFRLVDGFGRDVIAGNTIGDTGELAGSYDERGMGFGFLFGIVAGMAATFTACNCVVFAMLPGLACGVAEGTSGKPANPWHALFAFVGGVLVVSAVYGLYVGALGPEGVEALNSRGVRMMQARIVFSALGTIMLVWGLGEMGLLGRLGLPRALHDALASTRGKAAALGLMVGLFAVGRPFPVFREFLVYAAQAESPLYGAGVMMMQGLGQILLMVLLFVGLVWLGGTRLTRWAGSKPHQPRLVGAMALLGGGAYFVFYWGLARLFDIGSWGFKLGWYG